MDEHRSKMMGDCVLIVMIWFPFVFVPFRANNDRSFPPYADQDERLLRDL